MDRELVEGETKSAWSRRTIDLDARTVEVLRRHRVHQLEERMLVGVGYTYRDLVFATPTGEPWNPDAIGAAFARAIANLDLPRIRFHDLRHSHAMHLLASGANARLVSE